MILPIKVVSEAEAETVDFVVCCRVGMATPFDDNVFDVCAHCGHAIFFRPYMPKRPAKICVECATDLARAHGSPVQ